STFTVTTAWSDVALEEIGLQPNGIRLKKIMSRWLEKRIEIFYLISKEQLLVELKNDLFALQHSTVVCLQRSYYVSLLTDFSFQITRHELRLEAIGYIARRRIT
ncbi:hypothetical protein NPIL_417531, partial [Nephila pilipes]